MKRRLTTLSIVAVVVAALTWAAASGAEEPEPAAGGSAALESEGEHRSSDMIGALRHVVTAYEDTLLDIARANGLGYVEMIAANQGIDPWVPGENTPIVLPTAHVLPDAERQGLVVNLAEHRLYYFGPDGAEPETFPLGVGREGWGDAPRQHRDRAQEGKADLVPARIDPRQEAAPTQGGAAGPATILSAATRSISIGQAISFTARTCHGASGVG